MSRPIVYAWTMCIAAGVAVVVHGVARAVAAYGEVAAARGDLAATTAEALELNLLRSEGTELPQRPEEGLAAKVTSAMAHAGLAGSLLQSLSPEAQTPIPANRGAAAVRERATLSLQGLTLPQVGRFLDAWRAAEPSWVVSSIELSPMSSKDATGTDLPLRAVVTIEGLFKPHRRGQGVPR